MASIHRHLLPRPLPHSVRSLAYALLLAGIPWAAHGAVEIDARFIEITRNQADKPSPPILSDLPDPSSREIRLLGVLGESKGQTAIETFQKLKGADLLAAPRIVTLSGKRASVSIGREFQYPRVSTPGRNEHGEKPDKLAGEKAGMILEMTPTIDGGGLTKLRRVANKQTGVKLAVTPTVRRGGLVTLRMAPEVVDFEGFVAYGKDDKAIQVPVFATRKMDAIVSVRSGETTVLAMPLLQSKQVVEDRVPVLSRIPGLGKLFISRTEVTLNRNLYVLVTARVIDTKAAASGIASGSKH